ncbi:hypothetical protein VCUG_00734 [Vavraia culicis subsp. floridensis]|uniref:Uncharacterized protein n=1 Tax=Vavraia culicis (isolate floridensis) TaxID=948595 RepID=L2GWV9_VAVCU|nr:uncharacterized protein VCUG_00734 [Vavraia culicis subsp. floridensis]ELA47773.1 hypothetical protein VCUG_00734 [Vavraia culicis subsp. floridensis]
MFPLFINMMHSLCAAPYHQHPNEANAALLSDDFETVEMTTRIRTRDGIVVELPYRTAMQHVPLGNLCFPYINSAYENLVAAACGYVQALNFARPQMFLPIMPGTDTSETLVRKQELDKRQEIERSGNLNQIANAECQDKMIHRGSPLNKLQPCLKLNHSALEDAFSTTRPRTDFTETKKSCDSMDLNLAKSQDVLEHQQETNEIGGAGTFEELGEKFINKEHVVDDPVQVIKERFECQFMASNSTSSTESWCTADNELTSDEATEHSSVDEEVCEKKLIQLLYDHGKLPMTGLYTKLDGHETGAGTSYESLNARMIVEARDTEQNTLKKRQQFVKLPISRESSTNLFAQSRVMNRARTSLLPSIEKHPLKQKLRAVSRSVEQRIKPIPVKSLFRWNNMTSGCDEINDGVEQRRFPHAQEEKTVTCASEKDVLTSGQETIECLEPMLFSRQQSLTKPDVDSLLAVQSMPGDRYTTVESPGDPKTQTQNLEDLLDAYDQRILNMECDCVLSNEKCVFSTKVCTLLRNMLNTEENMSYGSFVENEEKALSAMTISLNVLDSDLAAIPEYEKMRSKMVEKRCLVLEDLSANKNIGLLDRATILSPEYCQAMKDLVCVGQYLMMSLLLKDQIRMEDLSQFIKIIRFMTQFVEEVGDRVTYIEICLAGDCQSLTAHQFLRSFSAYRDISFYHKINADQLKIMEMMCRAVHQIFKHIEQSSQVR